MLVYINGCSHTQGVRASFDGPAKGKNFAAKIEQKLKCKAIDRSIIGNDNRTIIDGLINFVTNSEIFPDYVIIQFTYPDRMRTPSRDVIGFKTHNPSMGAVIEHQSFDLVSHPDRGVTYPDVAFYQQYYNTAESRASLYLELTNDLKLAESFLKQYEIPYTFIVWPNISENAKNRNLFKSLDFTRILNYENNQLFGMESVLKSHDFLMGSKNMPKEGLVDIKNKYDPVFDWHFREDAHDFLADAVISHMNDGTKLLPKGDYIEKEKEAMYVYGFKYKHID